MTKTDEQTGETPAQPQKPAPKKRRRFGWSALFSLTVAGLVFFVLTLALTDRTVKVPEAVRANLEKRINQQHKAAMSLGEIRFGVSRSGLPQLLLNDIQIANPNGGAVAQLNWLGAEFELEQLVRGKVAPSAVYLTGAQITIRRTAAGAFELASGGTADRDANTMTDLLADLDQMLATDLLAPLNEIVAGGVVITLEDARSGRIWQATNASATLRKTPEALTLSVTSDVFNGTDNLAGVQVSLSRARATGHTSAGFSVSDMPAGDIALQSPILSWLGVLDAPISGSVRTEIDETGVLVDFAGTLEINEGALQPGEAVPPVAFSTAQAYFTFDPVRQRIDFSEVSLGAEEGKLIATGHTYLADFNGLWPQAYLGQFAVEQLDYSGEGFQGPVSLSDIRADVRLRLDPFSIEIGQLSVDNQGIPVNATGRVTADDDGWHAAIDATTPQIKANRVLELWPLRVSPISRGWIAQNLASGTLLKPSLGLRFSTGEKPDLSLSFDFKDGIVKFLNSMPRLTGAEGRASLRDYRFSLALTNGGVTAETGHRLDASGSRFTVLDTRPKPSLGQIDIAAAGELEGALSVLNNPPLRIMERANRPIDIASADAVTRARVTLPLKDGIRNEEVSYDVVADLTDISSDRLVEGRVFASPALRLTANNETVGLDGPATLDGVPLTARWRQPLGEASENGGTITGQVTLSPDTVAAFDLPLPDDLLRGRAQADYELTLPADGAPSQLVLQSNLQGLTMGLGAIGWQKPANQSGDLTIAATLGNVPEVTQLTLETPGLSFDGQLDLQEDGDLDQAVFQNLRVGDWLDADVNLTPSPNGGPPTITVTGGTLDIRQLNLGSNGGTGGDSGPIILQLDRLTVSDGIALAPLTGRLDTTAGGLSGTFKARLNGRTPVEGTLAPANAGTAFRLQSASAGGVLRDAGLTPNAQGGTLDIVLTPVSGASAGTFNGEFLISDIRLRNAPVMADLLDAISVVGLLDQLSGPGIKFETIDGQFRLNRRQIRLNQAAAVGTSIGISADGILDLRSDQMDFQGVISPVYFLNGIGSLLTRRGEGLFGFNYRMAGPAADPNIRVNPLSILTPGAFRQIFRRSPPGG